MTRNTLDLNAVPVLKALTHLPVIVDPSHGIGLRAHVAAMARGRRSPPARTGSSSRSTRARRRPSPTGSSRSRPREFEELMRQVRVIAGAVGRTI